MITRTTITNDVASALAGYLRVKRDGSNELVVAGDEDELGTLMDRVQSDGDPGTIIPRTCPGERLMVAGGAITQYAEVFAAANGKVAASGTRSRGFASEAASGDGSIIRVFQP